MPDRGLHYGRKDEGLTELRKLGFESRKEVYSGVGEVTAKAMATIDIIDDSVGSGGKFQSPVSPMEYDSVCLKRVFQEELEKQLSFQEKITRLSSDNSFLLSDIKRDILSESSIIELVIKIELLLQKIRSLVANSSNFYRFKNKYYSLYGNKRTMKNAGKDNLPIVRIHGYTYYLGTELGIDSMKKLALFFYSYIEKKIQ